MKIRLLYFFSILICLGMSVPQAQGESFSIAKETLVIVTVDYDNSGTTEASSAIVSEDTVSIMAIGIGDTDNLAHIDDHLGTLDLFDDEIEDIDAIFCTSFIPAANIIFDETVALCNETYPDNPVYELDVTVTTKQVGSRYNVSGDITGGPFAYGSAQTFTFPAPVTKDLTFIITDENDINCTGTGTIVASNLPMPCPTAFNCPLNWDLIADDACDDGCTYLLVLTDEAENGWDGASIDVSLNEAWPSDNIKLSPAEGDCKVIPLCINEEGTIDLEYWSGASDSENGFYLLDAQGNIAVDNTGTPVSYNGNIPAQTLIRINTACPLRPCLGETEYFTVRITLGSFPIEQSWEIYEGAANMISQANQVIGINATAYAGLAPGTELHYPISLDKCATYTFVAFDGYNDGWDYGAWEILTDNLDYGTEITNLQDSDYGDAVLIASPNSPFFPLGTYDFDDEDRVTFTIPCEPICTDQVVFGDKATCSSGGPVTLPIAVPEVCYPKNGHAKPDGCMTVQHIVLIDCIYSTTTDVVESFIALEGSINPYNGQTEMQFDGEADLFGPGLAGVLPLGYHKCITKYTYCDGIMLKCTADINVITDENPSIICDYNLILSLGSPDAIDDNITGSLNDDLNECVLRVSPDMVLEIPAIESTGVFKDFAFNEYELIIYNEYGTPLVVTEHIAGLPLDKFGMPIFPNSSIEAAHNLVGPAQLHQTLNYTVRHKFSNNTCWGTITIEDKTPPQTICNDYDLPCTHPNAMDEEYEETTRYSAADQLPANIGGGFGMTDATLELQLNTWIPINTGVCIAAAEIVNDIKINVSLSHDDVTDLQIFLHLPSDLNTAIIMAGGTGGPYKLADNNQVGTNNVFTPRSLSVPELQELLGRGCADAQTTNPETFVTENSGAFTPENLGGTWYIQIVDNDEGAGDVSEPVGGGEVIAASIDLTCGFPIPAFAYDCSLQGLNLLDERVVENNCDQSDGNGAQIVRVWQAIDKYGNGTTCTQTVNLKAPTIDAIQKPSDIELECEGQTAESITPDVSGGSFFGCYQLTEDHHGLCGISYTYEDQVLPTCGDAFNIIRTWTIINWCLGATQQYEQIITVKDVEGPAIVQDNVTVSTDIYESTADVSLEDLGIIDDCSGLQTATASYETESELVVVDLTNGVILNDLPIGVTSVTITATDACLNVTEKDITITVVDFSVTICNDELQVSLTEDGTARIYGEDFDGINYDDYSELTLAVRRLDGCLGISPWNEFISFECCDVDELVTVELRLTNAAGNIIICRGTALVEDTIPPTIVCPEDRTIDCSDESLQNSFDDIAIANDNCTATVTMEETSELDNCVGGVLIRTWTATDGSAKSPDVSCIQTITVEYTGDFTVQFPADVTLTNCPDGLNTDEPVISNDDCELVVVFSEDLILAVDDACYKIERTWTIINWCVYDPEGNNTDLGIPRPLPRTYKDDGDGYFKWKQTIKVLDDQGPEIDCPSDLTFCDLTEGCEGQANLILNVTHKCYSADLLEYSYKIDIFNDGLFDIIDKSQDASGIYPYGTHFIKWIVEDGCENTSVCSYLFTVEDCKKPTLLCLNELSVPAMNSDGCVAIRASDFLDKTGDNCSSDEFVENSAKIRRLGTEDPLESSINFCCEDLGTVFVEVWVWDEAGNNDFCETYVVLEDGTDTCEEAPETATIAGNIYTEYGDRVEEVMVTIESATMEDQILTNANGAYLFANVPKYSYYLISPMKDIDPLNGVSTYDLLLMHQHILGINNLNSPYKLIAADVNNDEKISTADVLQMRDLILHTADDYPDNTSWRFIYKDYGFPDPQNPWIGFFPEAVLHTNIDQNQLATNFIAVKIGDLNGTATTNSLLGSNDRNAVKEMLITVDNKTLVAGETYSVDFRANDFNTIAGYQFSLNFDADAMTFAGIEAGALNVTEANFGLAMLKEGVITTSWNAKAAKTVANDAVLFSINFTARTNVTLENALNINSRYTKAEAYTSTDLVDLALAFNTTNGTIVAGEDFVLYQNTPNPFNDATSISFNLPEASAATLKVYDVAGRVLTTIEGDYTKGRNTITIDSKDLDATGVLYYQLHTDTNSAIKKMIILD